MEDQTRQLIGLLANADVEAILNALRAGPATVKEIELAAEVPEKSVDRHLRALEGWGLVSRAGKARQSGKRGRPKARWRLEESGRVQQFSNIADGFALGLLEARAERLRDAVAERRREDLAPEDKAA